ncbi:MAG: succinate dehydrogenase, cytochrome b556 subunit [Burkholderiales bacterium]|nr:succinate dehydrogenase, cytochrome b556 subunit [Burkholderiales bacterium]
MAKPESAILPKARPRPEFRNLGLGDLARYRLPIPGLTSISHRVTGVAMFVALLFLLALLQMSLRSEAGFEAFRTMIWGNPVGKLVLIALLFALIFHLLAGVRHVIQEADIWMTLPASRASAFAVFGVSIVLTLLVVWRLW